MALVTIGAYRGMTLRRKTKCNKKKFDKIGIVIALADIGMSKTQRREIRSYWCKYCKAFHLTSEVKKSKQ